MREPDGLLTALSRPASAIDHGDKSGELYAAAIQDRRLSSTAGLAELGCAVLALVPPGEFQQRTQRALRRFDLSEGKFFIMLTNWRQSLRCQL